MGKHSGKRSDEPKTDSGKPFDQLTPAEKGKEFDNSHDDPKGYADRNFGSGGTFWGGGKRRR